jgi:hypothetical protein
LKSTSATQHRHQADPVIEIRNAKGKAVNTGNVDPDHPDEQSDQGNDEGLQQGTRAQVTQDSQAQDHDSEDLRGTELQSQFSNRRGQEHQKNDTHRSRDEGPEGRDAQSRACPSLPGHLITVDAGDRGRRFTGDVDQNGRCRTPVHGPVKNAREHNDGRGRRKVEGDRQQQGNGCGWPDSGENPDQGSHKTADQTEDEVQRGGRDAEPRENVGEDIHVFRTSESARAWGFSAIPGTGNKR